MAEVRMSTLQEGATSHTCCACGLELDAAAFRRSSPKEHGGWYDTEDIRRRPVCKTCLSARSCQYSREAAQREQGALLAGKGYLPVGPFRDWVLRKREVYAALYPSSSGGHGAVGFAIYIGLDERRLFDVVTGRSEKISVDIVDRALLHEGSTGLWELYPHLYAEEETA